MSLCLKREEKLDKYHTSRLVHLELLSEGVSQIFTLISPDSIIPSHSMICC